VRVMKRTLGRYKTNGRLAVQSGVFRIAASNRALALLLGMALVSQWAIPIGIGALLLQKDIAGGASLFRGQDIIGGAAIIFKRPPRVRDLVGGAAMLIVKRTVPRPPRPVERPVETVALGPRPVRRPPTRPGGRPPTGTRPPAETETVPTVAKVSDAD